MASRRHQQRRADELIATLGIKYLYGNQKEEPCKRSQNETYQIARANAHDLTFSLANVIEY